MNINIIKAAILAGTILALAACGGKTTEVQPLTVRGTTLYAGEEPVTFHGISFGWHNIWPRFYNKECVRQLHDSWGASIVRAAIGADNHALADNPNAFCGYAGDSLKALECAYAVIDGAVETGCYVIVDWHSHVTHQAEAEEFFATIAQKYAGVPNVIYELFNEPVCASFEAETENKYEDLDNPEAMTAFWQSLKAYAEPIIKIIADANGDYKPLILMGCPCWDQRIDLPAADPIDCYNNLMYTVHFYAATHKAELRDACDRAMAQGIPVFISECASCEASGDGEMDTASWQEWCSWADAHGISMLTWSISDKNETCSMFTPEASSEGPWTDDVIKPWGKVVKDWIK